MQAKRKNIKANDLITAVDGDSLESYAIELKDLFADLASGDAVRKFVKIVQALEKHIEKLDKDVNALKNPVKKKEK